MRHELVEREDVGEGSLDDDVATSVTLHFTKQDRWPPAQRAAGQLPTTPLPRHDG